MLFLLVIVVLFLAFVAKHTASKYYFRAVLQFPGPTPLPLLGNTLYFGNKKLSIEQIFLNWIREYGPTVRYYGKPFTPTLMITKPEHCEIILSSSININKSDVYSIIGVWLGNGLIVAPKNIWKHRRKVITPAFHFKILEQFISIFEEYGDILTQQIESKGNEAFDVEPLIKLYALDNICETSMGTIIDAQKNPNLEYVHSVRQILKIVSLRCFSVLKRNNFLFRFNKNFVKQEENLKILKDFTNEAISKRKQLRESPKSDKVHEDLGIKKKLVFIDLLLKLAEENSLSEEAIREEVDNFMFAGHDTITSSISIAIHLLAKHPEIQENMFHEIKSQLDGKLNINNLNNLKYMECVLKESMRFHSTVPFIERSLVEPVIIDGRKIPAGTCTNVFFYGMHRNPSIFPEPDRFDPERFSAENSTKRHPYAYVPFSAGPRNCIGQKYAMLVMKVAFVKLISKFVIVEVPNFELNFQVHITLKPVKGVLVKFTKRV